MGGTLSSRLELLRFQFDCTFRTVRQQVDGLDDDEFSWEPVAGCWSVRAVEDAVPTSQSA